MKYKYRVVFAFIKLLISLSIHLKGPFKAIKLYFTSKEIVVPDFSSTLFVASMALHIADKQWIQISYWTDWPNQNLNNCIMIAIVLASVHLIWIPIVSCLSISLQTIGILFKIEWFYSDIILRYISFFGTVAYSLFVVNRHNANRFNVKPCRCEAEQSKQAEHTIKTRKRIRSR